MSAVLSVDLVLEVSAAQRAAVRLHEVVIQKSPMPRLLLRAGGHKGMVSRHLGEVIVARGDALAPVSGDVERLGGTCPDEQVKIIISSFPINSC